MDNLNKRLKIYRKSNGWTQVYMAERLGITQSAYQQIETGDSDSMRVATLKKLCLEFNLNPSWLMGLSEEMDLEPQYSAKDLEVLQARGIATGMAARRAPRKKYGNKE